MSQGKGEYDNDEEEQEEDSSSLIPLEYDESSSDASSGSHSSALICCCGGRSNNSRRGAGGSIRPAAFLFGLALFLAGITMSLYGSYILATLTKEAEESGDDPHIKSRAIGLLAVGLLLIPPGAYELWRVIDGWIGCGSCCKRRRTAPAISASWIQSTH
eukprot:TRINITY_DN3434_c0_g1_i2.p1 TRINITY_DN3434_c0_g1~~TRINITY_DN3434_c0_g1_i2.p1  ORF type:complete len:159 (+),score=9.28 TRINITY_DN3434_c0_g1_i2:42-518(+)